MSTIIRLTKVTSTNTELKAYCEKSNLKSFTTLVAAEQTAGRGQSGNSWEAEAGKNLTFSTIIFPENLQARQGFIISRIFSVSIKNALKKYIDKISIKWPNDIYYEDKKICGIMIENDIREGNICRSIIGVGINVNQVNFLSDAPNPISLKQITNEDIDPDELLKSILKKTEENYLTFLDGNIETICSEYENSLYRKSGYYWYKDHADIFQAMIQEVKDDGTLVLKTEYGEIRSYLFKEVSFMG